MKRRAQLRSDPAKTRAWIDRSRRAIPRESAKRKAERARRLEVVDEVRRRDGDRCYAAAALPALTCRGPLDPHEVIPRSTRPGGHLDPGNVRLVCRGHHEWITDNPAAAASVGLHGWSWEHYQTGDS